MARESRMDYGSRHPNERQVMTIAEQIPHDCRGDYLERIAADLRRRCDPDGSHGPGFWPQPVDS
jgi:hypothetical protein